MSAQLFVFLEDRNRGRNSFWSPSIRIDDIQKLRSPLNIKYRGHEKGIIVLNNSQDHKAELGNLRGIWDLYDEDNLDILSKIEGGNINYWTAT